VTKDYEEQITKLTEDLSWLIANANTVQESEGNITPYFMWEMP
jgi:hypothetical protein